jgi:hypothetical protein
LVLLFVAGAGAGLWQWGAGHRAAAARAERERAEVRRFVDGLPPRQQEVLKGFGAWIQKRPQLAALKFEDAFALYKLDNPGGADLIDGVPPEIGTSPAGSFAPGMIGD